MAQPKETSGEISGNQPDMVASKRRFISKRVRDHYLWFCGGTLRSPVTRTGAEECSNSSDRCTLFFHHRYCFDDPGSDSHGGCARQFLANSRGYRQRRFSSAVSFCHHFDHPGEPDRASPGLLPLDNLVNATVLRAECEAAPLTFPGWTFYYF